MELAQEEVTSWLPGQGTGCRVACPGGGAGREGGPSTPERHVSAAYVTAQPSGLPGPVCRASPQRARGSLRFCKRGFPEDGKGAEQGEREKEREKERLFQQVLRWPCWQVF